MFQVKKEAIQKFVLILKWKATGLELPFLIMPLPAEQTGDFPFNIQTPYEWPKNTGEVYLALTGLVLGAEVTDNKGVLQHIIEEPDYRTSPTGKSWNLEPIPGYSNPCI